jgi:hypothetical protein
VQETWVEGLPISSVCYMRLKPCTLELHPYIMIYISNVRRASERVRIRACVVIRANAAPRRATVGIEQQWLKPLATRHRASPGPKCVLADRSTNNTDIRYWAEGGGEQEVAERLLEVAEVAI